MRKRKYMKNLTRFNGAILIIAFFLCALFIFLPLFRPSEQTVIRLGVTREVSCAEDTVFTSINSIEMCGKFRLRYPSSAYPLNVTPIRTNFGSLYVRSFIVGQGGALWLGEIPASLMNVSDPLLLIASSALNSTDNATTWHTAPDVYPDIYGYPTLFYDAERGGYREILEIKQCTLGTILYLTYIPLSEYDSVSFDILDSIASIKCV